MTMLTEADGIRDRRMGKRVAGTLLALMLLLGAVSSSLADVASDWEAVGRLKASDLGRKELVESLWAAYSLGENASSLEERIAKHVASGDPGVRMVAALAYSSVSGLRGWRFFHPGEALPEDMRPPGFEEAIASCVKSDDARVRNSSLLVLRSVPDIAVESLPVALPCLQSEDWVTILGAQALIRDIGPPASSASALLNANLSHPMEEVRESASLAIGAIEGDATMYDLDNYPEEALTSTAWAKRVLRSSDPDSVATAEAYLRSHPHSADDALPALRRNLEHPHPAVRSMAEKAIYAIENKPTWMESREGVIAELPDEDGGRLPTAVRVLLWVVGIAVVLSAVLFFSSRGRAPETLAAVDHDPIHICPRCSGAGFIVLDPVEGRCAKCPECGGKGKWR